MPTCANDAAETTTITSANNSQRMEGTIRILFPLAQSSFAYTVLLCCCGLRGLRGTIFGQNVLKTFVSLANGSGSNFLILETSKSGQKCSVRPVVILSFCVHK